MGKWAFNVRVIEVLLCVFRWPGVSGDRKRYEHDYLKLYIDTIYKVVKQEDPERPFMSSSPSNGIKTEMEGWITRSGNPGATKYGDSELKM